MSLPDAIIDGVLMLLSASTSFPATVYIHLLNNRKHSPLTSISDKQDNSKQNLEPRGQSAIATKFPDFSS